MPEYNPNNYTSQQIGEDYYEWVQEYLNSPFGSLADLYQPVLPIDDDSTEQFEDYLSEENPGMYSFYSNLISPWITDDDDFENFWGTYGNYFSQDYELGPASINREIRLGNVQQKQLQDQYQMNYQSMESQLGSTGFSGSGSQSNLLNNLWSEYISQSQSNQLQTNQALSNIYTSQGDSILDTLEDLGNLGAFSELGTDNGGG
tara:strand:- start:8354 stop:8962 length:609 start_codon:yes stop_codon:yes gene_type:complete